MKEEFMFEDALFATNHRRSPQQRWAALMSFALQASFVTLLVALPLFFTEALPLEYVRSLVDLQSPPPGRPPADPPVQARSQPRASNIDQDGRLVAVRVVPKDIAHVVEEAAPP